MVQEVDIFDEEVSKLEADCWGLQTKVDATFQNFLEGFGDLPVAPAAPAPPSSDRAAAPPSAPAKEALANPWEDMSEAVDNKVVSDWARDNAHRLSNDDADA